MSLQLCDRLYWPGGLTRAFTLSYDDGVMQDIRLVEMMNRYSVKGTFNINSGLLGRKNILSGFRPGEPNVEHFKLDAASLPSLYSGHEVAAHGQYHSSVCGMDSLRVTEEVLSCRRTLEQILHLPVTGYAYAFGSYDETTVEVLKNCGMLYSRTITSTRGFELPQRLLAWDPTCHHDDPDLFRLAETFLSDAPHFSCYSPAKLFYVWGHAYEFDQHDNWDQMETLLSTISGRDDVWYATNGEIASYLQAYQSLVFAANSSFVYNPSCTSVWIGSMFRQLFTEAKPGQVTSLLPPVEM